MDMKTRLQEQMIRKATATVTMLLVAGLVFVSACSSDSSEEENDTLPPAEVSNVNGISADGQVMLNWTDPADEDLEVVEITSVPGDNRIQVGKGEQTATIRNLTNGTAYTFTLRTIDNSGNRSNGITTQAYTPLALDPDDTTPPAEVTGAVATAGNGLVTLSWADPSDDDFNKVEITCVPGNTVTEVGKGGEVAVITGLTNGTEYNFTIRTVDINGNVSAGTAVGPVIPEAPAAPTVYMTTRITPESLMAIYRALGRTPAAGQKVAVKISTGENGSNYLRPALIGNFVQTLGGDIVECNTAYGGNRASTAMHYQLARDHGYNDIATVVIMDENSTMDIPVQNGTHLDINRVGAHFADYQFHVVLSHFKGHAMAGYGGALKNMSIGYASSAGKSYIHSGGTRWSGFSGSQNDFLESMAEAAKSIVDRAGSGNFIYINVMNRLSVDCDCDGHPAEPTMADRGILASLDPVALDKACLDIVESAGDGADLRARIRRQNGTLTTTHAAEIGLGSLEYELVSID